MESYKRVKRVLFTLIFSILLFNTSKAQIIQETGSLMGWIHNHITNDIPLAKSNGFVVPNLTELGQFERIFDQLLLEEYQKVSDSLSLHFPSYELVHLTDTSFINFEYYVIREKTVTKGWGTYVYNPNYQRDVMVAIPHPIFDSNTPYEGVDMLHYLGARMFTMAGTHRCASVTKFVTCSGTTRVCSDTNTSEAFRVSDMAHNHLTVFQKAHESLFALSPDAWFLNVHGHADNSCEDVFLSNGRADDSKAVLQSLRDALQARGINAAMAGDGSACTLTGSTNTQGRLVNGSSNPCTSSAPSNSGRFFHIEQFTSIRRSQDKYRILIEELANMIPREANTVDFPAFPELTINEIHFFPIAPGGDANGNGTVQTVSDEFVEIVNSGCHTINLSGWTLADNTQDRHFFSEGTRLISGQALVVFGGTFTGDFGGALVQTATSGTLNLNNNRETVILRAPTGAPVFSVSYDTLDTGFNGGSLVRFPDITGDFVYHRTIDFETDRWFSPGRTVSNEPFIPFTSITNMAGWRMLAAPTDQFPIDNLRTFTAIQGIEDAFHANLYTGYDGSSWVKPSSLGEMLTAGNGFILHFFNNAEAGSTPLPITLRASGTVRTDDVTINLHTNGDKYNLIGNPFNSAVDFSQIIANNGTLTSAVGHIWDPNSGAYVTTTALNNEIGAWQGMMIHNNTAESITFPATAMIESGKLANGNPLKSVENSQLVYQLEFRHLNDDETLSEKDFLFLVFDASANDGMDQLDAEKLTPLRNYNKLFAWTQESQNLLQLSLPFDEPVTDWYIREFGSSEKSIELELKQLSGKSIPLRITLEDLFKNETYELGLEDTSIRFWGQESKLPLKSGDESLLLSEKGILRFRLNIEPLPTSLEENSTEIPLQTALFQNYPNPFNPVTSISFSLSKAGNVTLEVYNILGNRVAEITRQEYPSGVHHLRFDGTHLSSGVYFYRLTTEEATLSRKMLLLK